MNSALLVPRVLPGFNQNWSNALQPVTSAEPYSSSRELLELE